MAATHTVDPALIIAVLAVFALLITIGVLVLPRSKREQQMHDRVEEAEKYRVSSPEAGPAGSSDDEATAITRVALQVADKTLRTKERRDKVADQLDRAGLAVSGDEWMLIRIAGSVLCAVVWVLLIGSAFIAIPIGVVMWWSLTAIYVRHKAHARSRAFGAQMPDVMQLVASSLRSGFSLNQALDAVVREGLQPASGELARALAETRLGVGLEDALDSTAERMDCAELAWTSMAVRISRQVGGNLAEVLMTTVNTMREREMLRRQVRTLSAEGRLSAYVLGGLPIGVGLWLFMMRREYLRPLWTTGVGIGMLVAASLAMLTGIWWLSRVVKVEV